MKKLNEENMGIAHMYMCMKYQEHRISLRPKKAVFLFFIVSCKLPAVTSPYLEIKIQQANLKGKL